MWLLWGAIFSPSVVNAHSHKLVLVVPNMPNSTEVFFLIRTVRKLMTHPEQLFGFTPTDIIFSDNV